MTSETRVERVTHGPAPNRQYIYDGNAIIAETDDYESAQRIVRAVNSHDDLLAALEAALTELEHVHKAVTRGTGVTRYNYRPEMTAAEGNARAAIKRARGED